MCCLKKALTVSFRCGTHFNYFPICFVKAFLCIRTLRRVEGFLLTRHLCKQGLLKRHCLYCASAIEMCSCTTLLSYTILLSAKWSRNLIFPLYILALCQCFFGVFFFFFFSFLRNECGKLAQGGVERRTSRIHFQKSTEDTTGRVVPKALFVARPQIRFNSETVCGRVSPSVPKPAW